MQKDSFPKKAGKIDTFDTIPPYAQQSQSSSNRYRILLDLNSICDTTTR